MTPLGIKTCGESEFGIFEEKNAFLIQGRSPPYCVVALKFNFQKKIKNHLNGKSMDKIVVVVICSTRPKALGNHLEQLVKYRPSKEKFPIVISQDGNDNDVTKVAQEYASEEIQIQFVHVILLTLRGEGTFALSYCTFTLHSEICIPIFAPQHLRPNICAPTFVPRYLRPDICAPAFALYNFAHLTFALSHCAPKYKRNLLFFILA
jgi:hypothetical protein